MSQKAPISANVVERNIKALLKRQAETEAKIGWQDRIAELVTNFTGSMKFVYLHLAIFGIWVVENLGWIPFLPRFDPSFVILAMFASVEAIFLSTFILITQNRIMRLSDRRAELNLQINLLAEHETTRLIQLLRLICDRLGIEPPHREELAELSRDVHPEDVLDTIEKHEEKEKARN